MSFRIFLGFVLFSITNPSLAHADADDDVFQNSCGSKGNQWVRGESKREGGSECFCLCGRWMCQKSSVQRNFLSGAEQQGELSSSEADEEF